MSDRRFLVLLPEDDVSGVDVTTRGFATIEELGHVGSSEENGVVRMKEWKIDIVEWDSTGLFALRRNYAPVERRVADLERAGWTIFSVGPEPTSASVMIVCWRMKT